MEVIQTHNIINFGQNEFQSRSSTMSATYDLANTIKYEETTRGKHMPVNRPN